MDSATNVNEATADYNNIQATDVVTGSNGTADSLTLTNAAAALSFAAGGRAVGVTNFEKLVLANGTNAVTMNTAMTNSIAGTVANGQFHTVTGGTGYDTITVLGAATTGVPDVTVTNTVNTTTVTGIEQFNVTADSGTTVAATGDAVTNLTFTGGAATGYIAATSTAGAAGEDATVNITVGNFVGNNISVGTTLTTGGGANLVTVNGGNQMDTLTLVGGATVSTSFDTVNTTATGVTLTLTGGVSQTVNATGSTAASVNAINLAATNNSDTINLATTLAGGATSVTVDTVTLSANNTIANIATVDTITGFQFGVDKINAASAGVRQFDISLDANTTAANFLTTLTNAALAKAGYTAAATGDALLVTVAAGSALAGTYMVVNTGAAALAATDEIIKLAGTTGVFTAADVI